MTDFGCGERDREKDTHAEKARSKKQQGDTYME